MGNKTYSAELKAKAVLELLKEEKTASELAMEYGTSAKQIYNWRKEFLENAHRVFSQNKIEKEAKEENRQIKENEQDLMAKVGRLTIENDWLKKKSGEILGFGWETRAIGRR